MTVTKLYPTEKSILEGIRGGDERAVAHLYKAYFGPIRRFVLNNSGTEAQAKDIYQDTVIAFFERVTEKGIELHCTIGTFLYSIARRLWLKQLKQKGRNYTDIHEVEEYIPVEEGIGEEAEQISALEEQVMNTLEKMGNPCKKLLQLFYFQKLNMKQIAEKMGYTNAENAKNQKARCMKRLRKLVAGVSNGGE